MTELDRGPSLPDESPIIVQEMAAIESSATEASEGPEREFTVAARSQFRIVLRRFLHHKLAVVSLVILILLFFMSLFGGAMWKYRPTDETNDLSAPPSLEHPMGTDSSGHDYYALVLAGAQKSVEIALIVAVVTGVVGTAIGAIAGYYGGFTDSVLMRITDLFLVVPELVIFALLANKFASAGWEFLALSLAGVLWVYAARVIRGVFISLREKDYVEAARALGASNRRIIFRHLLPNATGPIIVNITRDHRHGRAARDLAQLPRAGGALPRHLARQPHLDLPGGVDDAALALLLPGRAHRADLPHRQLRR